MFPITILHVLCVVWSPTFAIMCKRGALLGPKTIQISVLDSEFVLPFSKAYGPRWYGSNLQVRFVPLIGLLRVLGVAVGPRRPVWLVGAILGPVTPRNGVENCDSGRLSSTTYASGWSEIISCHYDRASFALLHVLGIFPAPSWAIMVLCWDLKPYICGSLTLSWPDFSTKILVLNDMGAICKWGLGL